MPNFIRDINRFNLADPPQWWLKLLADFDAKLVLIPSRQYPVYLLARRAKQNPLLEEKERLASDRDVRLLASLRLVYVSVLQGTGLDQSAAAATFHTGIFNELRRRDITRQGGWEKYVKTVEDFEEDTRQKQMAGIAEDEKHLDREAYKSLKRRVGERLQAPGPTADGRPHPTL